MTDWGGPVDGLNESLWCVLRTSGRGTLSLADSLSGAGIEAWAPRRELDVRRPRSRCRSRRIVPLMPSYVFARVRHLEDLVRLSDRPGRHEGFSLFRYFGKLALFSDDALEPLRSAETRALPRRRRRTYRPGQMVRVPEGNFGGMSGIVERSDGRYTMVCFGGSIRVKIATFLLRENEAHYRQPGVGTAAKAA